MKYIQQVTAKQQGAVSLFVVIFTALLITTITISFMQVMMRDQQQAMYSDLSESAYDSAVAGVEDAKRALLMKRECGSDTTPRCNTIRNSLSSETCQTLANIFSGGDDETAIIQTEGDRRLEQAYTCVKVTEDTGDYLGTLDSSSDATLVPLKPKGDSVNRIVISWALSRSGGNIELPAAGVRSLPDVGSAWPESFPALLRAQLINGQNSFKLSDFDNSSSSSTLFLYPSQSGLATSEFALDGRRDSASGEPQLVSCQTSVSSGEYACQVSIEISPSIQAGSTTSFLKMMAFYRSTDYRVEMFNGSTRVFFDGVQPEVDSTGRANDLFRRVVSRVETNNAFNYPVAALETRNNICKDFSVTTDPADYGPKPANCVPTEDN